MEKNRTEADIAALIGLCYKIASYIDERGEADDHFTLDAFGLGYRAASWRLRKGIHAIVDLEEQLHSAREREKLAKISEKDMHDFMVDIFGDDDEIYCVNAQTKERMKELVRQIQAEEDAEDDE